MSEAKPTAFPVTLPKGAPRGVSVVMLLLLVAGAVVFWLGQQSDPSRAWRAYLISVMLFNGLAYAGCTWGAVTRLSNGRFARPVLRIMEGLGTFQFAAIVLFAVYFAFGARHVYPWIHEEYKPVPWWLTLRNVATRDMAALILFSIVNFVYMRSSLRPELALLKNKVPAGLQGLYMGVSGDFGGSEVELARHRKFMLRMSPAIIILFAVVTTLLAFDLLMSIDMEWTSTMFGGIIFMGQFLGGIAATAVIATIVRKSRGLEGVFGPTTLHDLGKLVFALSVFWALVHWSEYLPIWYGKQPEETHWMVLRLSPVWKPWTYTAIAMVFAIPFIFTMNMATKKNPVTLRFFSMLILAGLWLERFVIVTPTVSPLSVPFGLLEVMTAVGFLGLFSLCYLWYLERFPLLPPVDPIGAGH